MDNLEEHLPRRHPLQPISFTDAVRYRRPTVEDLLGPEVVADYEAKEAAARQAARESVRWSKKALSRTAISHVSS